MEHAARGRIIVVDPDADRTGLATLLVPGLVAAGLSAFMFGKYGTGPAIAAGVVGGLLGATIGPATMRERQGRGFADPVVALGALSGSVLFIAFLLVRVA